MATTSDMTHPVTRGELREELARFATKRDLEAELERFATKQDLETWAGAIIATLRKDLAADVARHIKAANEEMKTWLTGFEDKYRDLPPRVTRLEATVFAPKRRRR